MQAGGALMLGGEQDCYGGCTDASQAFYGLMDEVCPVVSVSPSQLAEAASGHSSCIAGIKTPSGVVAAVGLSRLALYKILQRHPRLITSSPRATSLMRRTELTGYQTSSISGLMGSAWTIQVRLWRTERTKDEILRFMRISGSEELMNQRQDMIAYWDFNEPDDDRQATCTALQQLAALNDASQYQ